MRIDEGFERTLAQKLVQELVQKWVQEEDMRTRDCGSWNRVDVRAGVRVCMFDCFDMFDGFAFVVCSICTVYILSGSSHGALPVAAPRFFSMPAGSGTNLDSGP
jgi:hypothetical protein